MSDQLQPSPLLKRADVQAELFQEDPPRPRVGLPDAAHQARAPISAKDWTRRRDEATQVLAQSHQPQGRKEMSLQAPRLTKEQAIIIAGYTGYLAGCTEEDVLAAAAKIAGEDVRGIRREFIEKLFEHAFEQICYEAEIRRDQPTE